MPVSLMNKTDYYCALCCCLKWFSPIKNDFSVPHLLLNKTRLTLIFLASTFFFMSFVTVSNAQAPQFMLERRDELLGTALVPYGGRNSNISIISNTVNEMVVACLFQGRVDLARISELKRQINTMKEQRVIDNTGDSKHLSELYVRLWEMEFSRCRLS